MAGVRVGLRAPGASECHCDLPCDRPRSWPARALPSLWSFPSSVCPPPHFASPGLTSSPQLTLRPVLVLPLLDPNGHTHVLEHLHLPPRSFLGTPFFPCSSGCVWSFSLCHPCALLPSVPLKCWESFGLLPLGDPTLLVACLTVSVIETSTELPV